LKPENSLEVFNEIVRSNGVDILQCTPQVGFNQMFYFFEKVVPVGCLEDEARLLFQWSCFKRGQDEFYRLDLTRQFIESRAPDDDIISQLSLTFCYWPDDVLRKLGHQSVWFEEVDGIDHFRQFVFSSPAYLSVAVKKPVQVELQFSYT